MSMTREEAIKRFEKQLTEAMVVLDSGFGTRPGESDLLYRKRKEMAEIALQALREQEENRWIPVTERLPRKLLHVLVYTPGARKFNAKCVGEAWIGVDGCWHSPVLLVDNDKVTHWKPHPAPPKEETT